jgi:hypothetical protein
VRIETKQTDDFSFCLNLDFLIILICFINKQPVPNPVVKPSPVVNQSLCFATQARWYNPSIVIAVSNQPTTPDLSTLLEMTSWWVVKPSPVVN